MDPKATGKVKIIAIPSGEAPEHIRKAWVGLTLPCYPVIGYLNGVEVGALSAKVRAKNRRCVSVPQETALAVLAEHSPDAAAWWRAQGFPRKFAPNFSFGEDECKAISGVTYQRVIEVPDEAMGDPSR